jgi:glutamate/tyrosine decarboxylase-like PLP-dependent enzyme
VSSELKKLDFEVLGNPRVCIVSFRHKRFSAGSVFKFMKTKGWGFALLQNPLSIHFSFTPLNCLKRDEMIKDLKECVEYLTKNSTNNEQESSEVQLYGACASIPDVGTKNELMSTILDIFIDLS